jgi:hypothetical protein
MQPHAALILVSSWNDEQQRESNQVGNGSPLTWLKLATDDLPILS